MFSGIRLNWEGLEYDWECRSRIGKDQGAHLEFSLDLPGFKKEELQIDVIDQGLRVHGKSKNKSADTLLLVGKLGDSALATAALEDGVLTVKVPKVEAKRIEIK